MACSRHVASDQYHVDVPGIGTFTFWRRTEHYVRRIDGEKDRLLDGLDAPNEVLNAWATVTAVLAILTVGQSYERIVDVYAALREQEKIHALRS